MAQNRTPEQKAGDAQKVFDLLRDSVTPPWKFSVLWVGEVPDHENLVQEGVASR